jgi:hypothetical protein
VDDAGDRDPVREQLVVDDVLRELMGLGIMGLAGLALRARAQRDRNGRID